MDDTARQRQRAIVNDVKLSHHWLQRTLYAMILRPQNVLDTV